MPAAKGVAAGAAVGDYLTLTWVSALPSWRRRNARSVHHVYVALSDRGFLYVTRPRGRLSSQRRDGTKGGAWTRVPRSSSAILTTHMFA